MELHICPLSPSYWKPLSIIKSLLRFYPILLLAILYFIVWKAPCFHQPYYFPALETWIFENPWSLQIQLSLSTPMTFYWLKTSFENKYWFGYDLAYQTTETRFAFLPFGVEEPNNKPLVMIWMDLQITWQSRNLKSPHKLVFHQT